jgi:protein translocase, SecG subunit
VGIIKIVLVVFILLTSFLLILTVLMHKGRGGGISDMFGGGISNTAGSSGVAEKNLNRITVGVLVIWALCVIAYGILLNY